MGETRSYSSAGGHGSLLKSSARIVLRNLHHLLQLAALCLYVPCVLTALLKAISPPPPLHFNSLILQNLCYPYFIVSQDIVSSARREGRGEVVLKLAVVVSSLLLLVGKREAFEPATMMAICRDFGMVAMVVTIGGAIYVAQKLARSSPHGEEVELELKRSRGKWANKALTWCPYTVCASTWAVAIAYWVLLVWSSQLELAAERHGAWWRLCSGVVVGASVLGMPPLLLTCLFSTQAALCFSCSSYSAAAPHDDDQPLRTPIIPSGTKIMQ